MWTGGAAWLLAALGCLRAWELGSAQTARPRVVPAMNETTVLPGETVRLRCEADRPVTWHVASQATDITSRTTITNEQRGDPTSPYISSLEIKDVVYLDVGYLSCRFQDSHSSSESEATVYLFVNDAKHPLVKTAASPFIMLTQNRPGLLPCRPTHRGVKISLLKDGRKITDLDAQSITYKPTEGFIVQSPVLFHSGTFICRARYGAIEKRSQLYVMFNRYTESVQQPVIDKSDAQSNALLGHNFSLQCTVNRELAQHLDINWTVPAGSTGLKTGRIRVTNSSSSQTVSSTLLVTNTRREDAGNYTCTARDHNGHTNSRTEHVPVYRPDMASVKLHTDMRNFRNRRVGSSVKIVVNIDARPTPDVVWYNPQNQEVISLPKKYHVSHTGDQAILEVLDLSLRDMGQYKVVATASSGNSTASDKIVFNVTVKASPRVQLGGERWYYCAGQTYVLLCSVAGYPTPRVHWRFRDCTRPPCDDEASSNLTLLANEETETQVTSKPYLVASQLNVTASRPGYYECHAENDAGPTPAKAELRFFVSDIDGGFGVVRSKERVIDGDALNLTCGGSRLDFSSPADFTWTWSHTDNGQGVPAANLSGVREVEETTEYSHRKVLVFSPARMQHAGLYVCSGVTEDGEQNKTQTWLGVVASQIPVFTDEASMDRSESLRVEEGGLVMFNCTVSGRPEPTVTWSKDGLPLRLDQGERIRLTDGGQRLLISAVLDDDAGNYECQATNREGTVVGSAQLVVPGDGGIAWVAAPAAILCLIFIAVIACLVRQQKKLERKLSPKDIEKFQTGAMSQFNPAMPIDEQTELLPYDQPAWEFPKDRLILGRQIGSGAFGRVLRAEAIGLVPHESRTVVAVKMPKSGSDPDQIRSLMAELKIMIQLGRHLNVVNLLGAVTKHAVDGEFMVLVEYCRHGNLHQYLHRHKHSFINQVHPITGEYDPSLGEEECRTPTGAQTPTVSDSAPLNYASLEHGSDGRVTLTPGGSFYQSPRRGSTASSNCSAPCTTGGSTGDTVCHSPSAIDSEGRPRFNTLTAGAWRPRRTPLATRDLLRWSYQVARGMEYLASRKLLHGDLAARNILLAENGIVKISDFGLSRDIYKRDYKKKGKGLLPVKWMAIESIQDSIFSTQSDVWAFGVVLWELFSLGAAPYPGMEYDNNFVRRLRDGYRMEAPKFSPNAIYDLMLKCWREGPSDRPSFMELSESLGHCLEENVKKEYVRLNEPLSAMNAEYFSRRTDYVNALVSPDYENVVRRDAGSERGSVAGDEHVSLFVDGQTAGYTPGKDGGSPPLQVDADSYLLVSPGREVSPDEGIFSPRHAKGSSHFEFPPPQQMALEADPSSFFNPSYQPVGKAPGGQVPSTPKMGTRVTRPRRQASREASAADEEHYRFPVSDTSGEHYQYPKAVDQGSEHYRCPVPVGCEQLA